MFMIQSKAYVELWNAMRSQHDVCLVPKNKFCRGGRRGILRQICRSWMLIRPDANLMLSTALEWQEDFQKCLQMVFLSNCLAIFPVACGQRTRCHIWSQSKSPMGLAWGLAEALTDWWYLKISQEHLPDKLDFLLNLFFSTEFATALMRFSMIFSAWVAQK